MIKDKINLIIVDDHQLFSEALKNVLPIYGNINVIGTAKNAHELWNILELQKADIIFLDLGLGATENGFDILKQIKERNLLVKTLIISMHTQRAYIENAELLGANGFLAKESPTEELLLAIESVLKETKFYCKIDKLFLENPFVNLTKSEIEIAKLLLSGKNNKEISEITFRSKDTVDTHRKNIYKKLEINSIVDLVKLGYRHGFVVEF